MDDSSTRSHRSSYRILRTPGLGTPKIPAPASRLRASMLRRVGGVPCLHSGEDRALIGRLRLIDARVRHDPQISVIVSGRIEGRAQGGMADTMRRRMVKQDEFADDRVEPAWAAFDRLSDETPDQAFMATAHRCAALSIRTTSRDCTQGAHGGGQHSLLRAGMVTGRTGLFAFVTKTSSFCRSTPRNGNRTRHSISRLPNQYAVELTAA